MKAVLYDCSDHPDARYRGCTLRLIDDTGRMVLQGQVLTNNGRDLAERIAAGLGATLTFVGPPASAPAKPVLSPVDQAPVAVATDAIPMKPWRNKGWLF